MGTSLAIVGAYVLAHELHAAGDDHAAAFAAYQRLLARYVARCQKLAADNINRDISSSGFGRFVQGLGLRLLGFPFVRKLVARQSLAVGRSFTLPDY